MGMFGLLVLGLFFAAAEVVCARLGSLWSKLGLDDGEDSIAFLKNKNGEPE
jgi:hypothetical protein